MAGRHPLLIACCGALLLPVAAGCGSKRKPPDPKAEIRRTAEQFGAAFSRRDGALICTELLTKRLRGLLESGGLSCAAAIKEAAGSVEGARLEVLDAGVDSKTAGWATVRSTAAGQAPSTDRLRFALEGSRWRVAALDSSAPAGETSTAATTTATETTTSTAATTTTASETSTAATTSRTATTSTTTTSTSTSTTKVR